MNPDVAHSAMPGLESRSRVETEYPRALEVLIGAVALAALLILPLADALAGFLDSAVRPAPSAGSPTGYLSLWVAFTGAALAARQEWRQGSLRFESLKTRIPRFARWWASVVSCCVLLALYWASLSMISGDSGSSVRVAFVPQWLAACIIPIGFALIGWRFFRRVEGGVWGKVGALVGMLLTAGLAYLPIETRDSLLVPGILILLASWPAGAPLFVTLSGIAMLVFYAQGLPSSIVSAEVYRITTDGVFPGIPLLILAAVLFRHSRIPEKLSCFIRSLTGDGAVRGRIADLASRATVTALAPFAFPPGTPANTDRAGGELRADLLLLRSGRAETSVPGGDALGLLLPPCLIVALTASWTALPPVGLYRASLRIAALLFVLLCCQSWLRGRRPRENNEREKGFERTRPSWRAAGEVVFLVAAASLFSVGGVTVPQAASILALGVLILSLLNRDYHPAALFGEILTNTLAAAGSVMILLFSALALNGSFGYMSTHFAVQESIGGLVQSPALFLLAFNFALLLLLPAIDPYAAVFLIGPLLPAIAEVYGVRWEQLALIQLLQIAISRLWQCPSRSTGTTGVKIFLRGRPWLSILIFMAAAMAVSYLPFLLGPGLRPR